MGFLEKLGLGMAMAVYNAAKDDSEDKRVQGIKQEALDKIGGLCTSLFTDTIEIAHQLTPDGASGVLVNGAKLLPIYIYHYVLKCQTTPIASEQRQIVEIYLNQFDSQYTMAEFMSSLTRYNTMRQEMEELVGLNQEHIGDYWRELFKTIKKTTNSEHDLSDIVDDYTKLVSEFSTVCGSFEDAAYNYNSEFIDAVYAQFKNIQNELDSETDLDIYCEKSIEEHYSRMKEITEEIVFRGQDDKILEDFFGFFIIGLLVTFLERSTLDFDNKCAVLAPLTEKLNVDIGFDSETVLMSIGTGNQLEQLTYQLVNNWDNSTTYWEIQGIVAQKGDCQQLTIEFLNESVSFLIGIEMQLKDIFPEDNLGKLSLDIATYLAGNIAKLYS